MTAQTEVTPAGPWRPADTLGARLVLIRRQLRLSQREAAERTGIGYGSWQSMEDDRSPRDLLDKVQRVCSTFGVDRDWLLWGAIPGTTDQSLGENPVIVPPYFALTHAA